MSLFFFSKGCKILRQCLKQQIFASTSLIMTLDERKLFSFYLSELQVVVCLTDQIRYFLLNFCFKNEHKEISEFFF